MARRREQTVERNGDDVILPRHLADQTGLSADECRAFNAERRAWFKARGINPGDWKQVYPILQASWAAYGINRGALTRARLRVADPRQVLADEIAKEN